MVEKDQNPHKFQTIQGLHRYQTSRLRKDLNQIQRKKVGSLLDVDYKEYK
jgi:hypothetical protein